MEYQATMTMQAASSPRHQSVYLPASLQEGLVLLLSHFTAFGIRLTRSGQIGSEAHAVRVAGVVIVGVTVVVNITEIGSGARVGRPQPRILTYRTKPKFHTIITDPYIVLGPFS